MLTKRDAEHYGMPSKGETVVFTISAVIIALYLFSPFLTPWLISPLRSKCPR